MRQPYSYHEQGAYNVIKLLYIAKEKMPIDYGYYKYICK